MPKKKSRKNGREGNSFVKTPKNKHLTAKKKKLEKRESKNFNPKNFEDDIFESPGRLRRATLGQGIIIK